MTVADTVRIRNNFPPTVAAHLRLPFFPSFIYLSLWGNFFWAALPVILVLPVTKWEKTDLKYSEQEISGGKVIVFFDYFRFLPAGQLDKR